MSGRQVFFQETWRESMKGFNFLPLVLILLLLIFLNFDLVVRQIIRRDTLINSPVSALGSTFYPSLSIASEPMLSAQSALIIDDSSKVILFSKNPTLRFSTASTAKIMTALVALDFYKMDDVITVQSDNVMPFVMGFKIGERLIFSDMLYSLLLPSANDAAVAIAQNYPGGETAFVDKMNQYAHNLHLVNTHFGDPAGLLDSQNYTNALDLAELASYALKNKQFAQVVSTKQKSFTDLDGENFLIYSRNKLLGIDGIDGVKTGYTEEAGEVLVTSKLVNGHRIIIVVMGSDDRFADTLNLLHLIFGNITYLQNHL